MSKFSCCFFLLEKAPSPSQKQQQQRQRHTANHYALCGTQHFHRVGQHTFQLVVALSSHTESNRVPRAI